jgi:glycosyltransferase involved in cell wall biosynthesis
LHPEKKFENPRVTVVTVVFNRVTEIAATIESVLGQSYNNVEYIVIDGGSTDGTLDIIKQYNDRISYWVSEPDKGIYDAMNKAIRRATGEWINFMNCGDKFVDGALVAMFSEKHHEADVIYGDALVQYTDFQNTWRIMRMNEMWKRTPFCHQSCFVRTVEMKRHLFDLNYKLSSDFDFLYKIYLEGKTFQYVNTTVCIYDYRDGATIRQELRSLRERRHAVLKHGWTFEKWHYYARVYLYMRTATFVKRILGKNTAAWVTRLLKK